MQATLFDGDFDYLSTILTVFGSFLNYNYLKKQAVSYGIDVAYIWGMGLIGKLLFSDTAPKVARKAVDFNAQKVAMTAANIANAETPDYKASHLKFESILQSATSRNSLKMKTTNSKHFSMQRADFSSMRPDIEIDGSRGRVDGNNVNLEKEITNLAEAKIAYDANMTAMTKRGGIIKAAIMETR